MSLILSMDYISLLGHCCGVWSGSSHGAFARLSHTGSSSVIALAFAAPDTHQTTPAHAVKLRSAGFSSGLAPRLRCVHARRSPENPARRSTAGWTVRGMNCQTPSPLTTSHSPVAAGRASTRRGCASRHRAAATRRRRWQGLSSRRFGAVRQTRPGTGSGATPTRTAICSDAGAAAGASATRRGTTSGERCRMQCRRSLKHRTNALTTATLPVRSRKPPPFWV